MEGAFVLFCGLEELDDSKKSAFRFLDGVAQVGEEVIRFNLERGETRFAEDISGAEFVSHTDKILRTLTNLSEDTSTLGDCLGVQLGASRGSVSYLLTGNLGEEVGEGFVRS